MRFRLGIFLLAALLASQVQAAEPLMSRTMLRRPVALQFSGDGKTLYVANQQSGTVSVVDAAGKKVVAEVAVGKKLSSLVILPQRNLLLATDEAAHELILLKIEAADQLNIIQRLPVSPYPASIIAAADGKRCFVASLWSRRLSAIDIKADAGQPLVLVKQVDLSFAPREQTLLPKENKLAVADAFAGRLAFFDPADLSLQVSKEFPGHNIRGLGMSQDGQKILVAHQMLNDLAHTIQNDVHWGMLMSNDLRWLKVESALAGGKELYHGAHMHPLGEPGKGSGDPGGLDVSAAGAVVVTLSGINHVTLGKEDDFSLYRVPVGKRPVAVKIAPDGNFAFVANMYDDSLSIVSLAERETTATIALGKQTELTQIQQGEVLFHDATLSHDGWMSCHSCHTNGHANGQLNDNLSDLSFGAPKRVLSLLGQKDTAPYAWNGKAKDFAAQIRSSLEKTMQSDEAPQEQQVQSIAAYLGTLELPLPLDVLRGTQDKAAVARGQKIFEQHDCARCHAPPTYTSPDVYDVGLKDKEGNIRFNPPSLRGLSHRGPLFHDGSAKTLEEVFKERKHPGDAAYSPEEVKDVVEFLRSL
ncbi:MAG: c-type cytochrome [Pirellulaceae bacterium]|nr:c-type cytochrome [Pirellulaceae bacterium]